MRGSVILDTVTRAAFPTVLVFSLYLLFAGHNAPGGGFVGGLVAGSALVLRYIAGGSAAVRQLLDVRFQALLGAGLLLAGLTGAGAWLFGAQFLESAFVRLSLPVVGELKIVSALLFDAGVYLIVVGLTLAVVEVLGEPPGDEATEDPSLAEPSPGARRGFDQPPPEQEHPS